MHARFIPSQVKSAEIVKGVLIDSNPRRLVMNSVLMLVTKLLTSDQFPLNAHLHATPSDVSELGAVEVILWQATRCLHLRLTFFRRGRTHLVCSSLSLTTCE